ncbi:unnamed protein product [Didymodactylos carnosus]|uniref:Uncharacterized protein n=1 Tax=Didymodactylos carnosus TaxID=1234261 RepID=A0A815MXL6_9BILA|nr:unnamed protein product [Didymodactylos carnosus]CAF4308698.1 unnamed protein product [Didymodactylos carnosus]
MDIHLNKSLGTFYQRITNLFTQPKTNNVELSSSAPDSTTSLLFNKYPSSVTSTPIPLSKQQQRYSLGMKQQPQHNVNYVSDDSIPLHSKSTQNSSSLSGSSHNSLSENKHVLLQLNNNSNSICATTPSPIGIKTNIMSNSPSNNW